MPEQKNLPDKTARQKVSWKSALTGDVFDSCQLILPSASQHISSNASAEIHSDETAKVMEADTSPEEYNVKDPVTVFIFSDAVLGICNCCALDAEKAVRGVLTKRESPFRCEVVNRMSEALAFLSSCRSVRLYR